MSDFLQLRAEIRTLASRLQEAAYRHGDVDSSDRWSDKKYRDACDRSNAALTVLLNRIDDALNLSPIPAGFVLVPAEATDAMVQAAGHIDLSYMPGQEGADRAAIYRAMIAAAQEPKP